MTRFERLYAIGIRLTPSSFRERYGREAIAMASRRVRGAPPFRRHAVAARELVDLARTIWHERRALPFVAAIRDRSRSRTGWLDALARDVRHALRSLRATPGFTAIALVILTLGIGASTAIFSVVDAVMLRGLPFDEGDRIMAAGRASPGASSPGVETMQTFLDWRDEQQVFDAIAASAGVQLAVVGEGKLPPEPLTARRVTPNLFDLLRVAPAIGRSFTEADAVPGQSRVALISDAFWRRRFGGRPDAVGQRLMTTTGAWEIVGVMPPGFVYPLNMPRPVDVWVPVATTAADRSRQTGRNYTWGVVGRLKQGVTVEQARADLQRINTRLAAEYPAWFPRGAEVVVMPLRDALVGSVRAWMLLLLGAVGCVLVIACVNVANLLLARASGRGRELAVRAALGGTRWQLARGLLVESLLLSVAGTLLGVVVAQWGVAMLRASMPDGVPRLASIAIDTRVLVAAAIAAAVTGLFFGMAPALQGSRADITHALRDGGRASTAGRGRQRLRATLVVTEVTLAVVLLVGAGLFLASFRHFASVDLGADLHQVLTLDAYLDYRDPSWHTLGRPFVANVVRRLRSVPGVESVAGVSDGLPLSGSWNRGPIGLPDRPAAGDVDEAFRHRVTPDYLTVLRVPLIRGRAFTDADVMGAPAVAIVNDVAERSYFRGESAVGQRIEVDKTIAVVVGVVGGVRVTGPEAAVGPEVYLPLAQSDVSGADFVIRTTGSPDAVRDAVKAAVRTVHPGQIINDSRTLEEYFNGLAAQRRFNMQLLGLFGLVGIVIAAAGIYGVMAYIVAQRTPEIGIRMALGAVPGQVLQQVLARATAYVFAGLACGLAGAWMLSRLVGRFLFEVTPHDAGVYGAVALLLLAAGLAAALLPARRAARVDPIIALRAE